MKKTSSGAQQDANQTVPLQIDTKDGGSSIRISFTDQRLTAIAGLLHGAGSDSPPQRVQEPVLRCALFDCHPDHSGDPGSKQPVRSKGCPELRIMADSE